MTRLTATGWGVLSAAVVLNIAAITSQSSLLLLLAGILCGCLLVNTIASRRTVRRLELGAPAETHLLEGMKTTQPWQVRNSAPIEARFIEASGLAGSLFKLLRLDANTSKAIIPDLVFQRRGIYSNTQIRLSSTCPFGLVRSSKPISLPGSVIVGPAVYPAPMPAAGGFDAMLGGKYSSQRRAASGISFDGIRPMQDGDSFRQIHWKSSAKGQGLMVKTFEEELSGRVTIILDTGHGGDGRIFDDCVRAAGSLIFAALDAGHHVECIDLAALKLRLMPPFAGNDEILGILAGLEMRTGMLTSERLAEAVEKASKRGALSLLLTACNEAVCDCVTALGRHRRKVSVYLPSGTSVPAAIHGLPRFEYDGKSIAGVP
jgi:uncharacterized protein (DUF58 family)